jgi:hypothetical protein
VRSSSQPEQLLLPPADAPAPRLGFTLRDTEEQRERVAHDMDTAVQRVRAADPHLRALVLTGGFARGEGAMLGGAPQNDYDFVAVRDAVRGRAGYEPLRHALERELGLHVDLRPVWAPRLRHVRATIFWYETAQRGRVLWGDGSVLERIPVRSADELLPTEGLRLLVNRAAGLLLAEQGDAHLLRIQASKGLLAALDAHLLALRAFAPSQRERWAAFEDLLDARSAPPALARRVEALAWAFTFKVEPERAPPRDARAAWRDAAQAILGAVPVALAHARLPSVEAYARRDAWLDNLDYRLRAGSVPGARRWALHATGRVRAATLAMLAGRLAGTDASQELRSLAPRSRLAPPELLAGLRAVTSQ